MNIVHFLYRGTTLKDGECLAFSLSDVSYSIKTGTFTGNWSMCAWTVSAWEEPQILVSYCY